MTESIATFRDPAGQVGWRMRLRVPAAAICDPAIELVAVVLLTPLLLCMAWWNRFPLLFYDTGAYMYQGFALMPSPERSPVYSLFLRYAGGQVDLWRVAWLQSLITAVAIVEFARAVCPRVPLGTLLGIAVALSLCTSLAFVTGQIQPDFLTPVLVLTFYPLAFHADRLGPVRVLVLVALCSFATAGHPSHFGLTAGLVVLLVALRMAAVVWRRRLPRPNLVLPALCLALGLGLIMQANYVLTHQRFFSHTGPFFFTARLLASGGGVRTLDEICPTQRLKLCPYRHQIPSNADDFLWSGHSPFDKIGRFRGPADEYALLARETLIRHPLLAAGGLSLQAVAQFFLVRSGDGFQPVQLAVQSSFVNHTPHQVAAYLAARQQHGSLYLTAFNVVHLPLALASLWWLITALRGSWRERRRQVVLTAFLFFALLGNATICGMISGAHDRYQSRLVWVVPFAFLLTEERMWRGLLPRSLRWSSPSAVGVGNVAVPVSSVANCRKYRDTALSTTQRTSLST